MRSDGGKGQTGLMRVKEIVAKINMTLVLSGRGFSRVPGRGGGVPAAYNSKTLQGIEMKFGMVVENHNLINLV